MDERHIRIHQQNRRSLVMKRTPVGLVVFIPKWLKPDSPQVKAFIEDGLRKLGTPVSQPQTLTTDDLLHMVERWAAHLGVQPGRIQFREMYRKWGSCSSRGNITLNVALCRLPPSLAENRVSLKLYRGGHMFYTTAGQRAAFTADAKAFYAGHPAGTPAD